MKKKILLISISVLSSIAILFAIFFFSTHFAPWTKVSTDFFTIDSEMQTKEELTNTVVDSIENIKFHITGTNIEMEIRMSDIATVDAEKLGENLDGKNLHTNINVDVKNVVTFENDKITKILATYFSNVEQVPSQNAQIEFTDGKYEITNETIGTVLTANFTNAVVDKITQYDFDIDLSELDVYEKPQVTNENEILNNNLSIFKKFEDFVLTYKVGEEKEIIDISIINKWLIPNYNEDGSLNKENPFNIDNEQVSIYLQTLKEKYIPDEFIFTTTSGKQIIYGTQSGEWVDVEALGKDIVEHIKNNTSEEKDMPYKTEPDIINKTSSSINNTYIEVSIDEQHIWMYIDDELIVDSDIVTGNLSRKHYTRRGVFNLTYKTRNATLRGPGYASFVYYWMPFDGGIGLHDATWRDEFGGEIYKTDGSHGCVNLPKETAKIIYENIDKTMPIIVW